MSVSFGRTTQNSFPSGSAGTIQDSASVWPMSTRRALCARGRSISWSRSAGAAGEVKMYAVLDRLGVGDRHEAHADGRVLVGPDDDLVLPLRQDLPAERLRPERAGAGRSWASTTMWWSRTGMPAVCAARWTVSRKTRCSATGGSISGGHATRWRPDRVINLIPRQPADPASRARGLSGRPSRRATEFLHTRAKYPCRSGRQPRLGGWPPEAPRNGCSGWWTCRAGS
jgi:hypothetical protein